MKALTLSYEATDKVNFFCKVDQTSRSRSLSVVKGFATSNSHVKYESP